MEETRDVFPVNDVMDKIDNSSNLNFTQAEMKNEEVITLDVREGHQECDFSELNADTTVEIKIQPLTAEDSAFSFFKSSEADLERFFDYHLKSLEGNKFNKAYCEKLELDLRMLDNLSLEVVGPTYSVVSEAQNAVRNHIVPDSEGTSSAVDLKIEEQIITIGVKEEDDRLQVNDSEPDKTMEVLASPSKTDKKSYKCHFCLEQFSCSKAYLERHVMSHMKSLECNEFNKRYIKQLEIEINMLKDRERDESRTKRVIVGEVRTLNHHKIINRIATQSTEDSTEERMTEELESNEPDVTIEIPPLESTNVNKCRICNNSHDSKSCPERQIADHMNEDRGMVINSLDRRKKRNSAEDMTVRAATEKGVITIEAKDGDLVLNSNLSDSSTKKSIKCHICKKFYSSKSYLLYHIANHTKSFECNECGQKYCEKSELEEHMLNHFGRKPEKCGICHKRCVSKKKLKAHLARHRKRFECYICQRKHSSNVQLKNHLDMHSGYRPFKCNLCSKRFTLKGSLKSHYTSHREGEHVCSVCGQKSKSKSHLKRHMNIHTGRKPYKCAQCGLRFRFDSSLKSHVRKHSGVKPFKCGICDKSFWEPRHLKGHQETHYPKSGIKCEQCGKILIDEKGLQSHLKTHVLEKIYECNECLKRFPYKRSVLGHLMSVHFKEAPYVCSECGRAFRDSRRLRLHMMVHSGEKLSNTCQVCNKKISIRSSMNEHMKRHINKPTHVCDQCGKLFLNQGSLKSHSTVHIDDAIKKIHACHICPLRFTHKCSLKKHLTLHAGIKPFKCHICERTFSRSAHLQVHIYTHTGEKPHECTICHKRFTQKPALRQHLRVHTDELPYPCGECPKRFRYRFSLNSHVEIHATVRKQLECPQCDKVFWGKESFDAHFRTHTGEGLFYCGICERSFSLKYRLACHMLTHFKAKPAPCTYCGKRYLKQSYLNKHISKHLAQRKQYKCSKCERMYLTKRHFDAHIEKHADESLFNCEICGRSFGQKDRLLVHMLVHFKQDERKPIESRVARKRY